MPETAAWLMLLYQLPARPTSARVQTWRRLRDLGAVALKSAAYVLPNNPQSREDFEWLKQEVLAMKGEAMVLTADAVDAATHAAILEQFRDAHGEAFAAVASDAGALAEACTRRRGGRRAVDPALSRQVRLLRERLTRLDAITFVRPDSADLAAAAVTRLERLASGSPQRDARLLDPRQYRNKTWVTRPRPGVDRMASAWLIRRFIDPRARFAFGEQSAAKRVIPFDMYGVPFSHHEGGCTYETLVRRFGLSAPAVDAIGEIVHDIDLKETKYGRAEAGTVADMVEGLRLSYARDGELLDHGIAMFEALFRSLSGRPAAAPGGSRRPKPRRRTGSKARR